MSRDKPLYYNFSPQPSYQAQKYSLPSPSRSPSPSPSPFYSPSSPSPSPSPSPSQQKKKKKNVWARVIIGIVIIAVIVGIVLLLYFLLPSSSSGGGNGGESGGSSGIPTPSEDAPYQTYTGSGGKCENDTDCPVIYRTENGNPAEYTQYCVDGLCQTNKVCTVNKDCRSLPGVDELPDCNLAGNGTASACRFTAGCSQGYCQRLRCKTSTDCGLYEACTIHDPQGNRYGYCLPIGNECSSNSVTDTSPDCWGGQFPCTALSGIGQGSTTKGYCTECYAGNNNSCNISGNPKGGPGSFCQTISGFNGNNGADYGAFPATCKMIDNFKYFTCPSGTVEGGTLNGNTVCCSSLESETMCGKDCLDDYQCSNSCPYCVQKEGSSSKVCSCVRVSATQYGAIGGTESTYSCVNGTGITYNYFTGEKTTNYINPNKHVCTQKSNPQCALSYTDYLRRMTLGLGNAVCSNINKPYCNLESGTCQDNLEGVACQEDEYGISKCFEVDDKGKISVSRSYVCNINNVCVKRDVLYAGENCTPIGGDYYNAPCAPGLVCSLPINKKGKRICVPEGFDS